MKEIRTQDAVGHILCHDITQIIKGEKGGDPSRKRGSRDPLQDFRRRAYAWK